MRPRGEVKMVRIPIMAVAICAASPALAAGWSEHWTATSNTASSVTGNVTLETSRIVFSGGKSLPIVKDKNVSFSDDTGSTLPATIYRVSAPADPSLLRGNRICGGGPNAIPVTYIAIWHTKPIMSGQPEGRAFAAYSGADEPPPSTKGACATYFYDVTK
jgi:hypothetical protein